MSKYGSEVIGTPPDKRTMVCFDHSYSTVRYDVLPLSGKLTAYNIKRKIYYKLHVFFKYLAYKFGENRYRCRYCGNETTLQKRYDRKCVHRLESASSGFSPLHGRMFNTMTEAALYRQSVIK